MSRRFLQNNLPLLLSLAAFVVLCLVPLEVLAQGAAAPPAPAAPATGSWGDTLNKYLWLFVSSLFGFLVWLTGAALDFTISTFIVEFGKMFREQGLGAAVNNLWMVVRDIFNLLFIFGLIWAGFDLIINSNEGGVRKTIANLIIAALLINFSLFITKTVIDFGNIAAVQVAKVLYESAPVDNNGSRSISGAFLYNMGASTIWSAQGRAAFREDPPSFIYIIGAMFLFMIASFSFMVGAVLISIRFIMLNYYMVISPVMFLGRIIPKFSSYTSNFWKDLLANVFFAPAFLLLLYFSLYILGSMTHFMNVGGGGGRDLFAAFNDTTNPNGNITTIMMFLMAAGFLIASVALAKKMGAVGGDMAVSIGQDFRKRGQRALGSVSGYYGRKYIGKYAAKYDKHLEGSGLTERSWRRSLASSVAKSKYGGSYTYKEAKDQDDKAAGNKARADAVTKISDAVKTANPSDNRPVTPEQKIAMERAISGASNEQIMKVFGGLKEGTPEYKAFVASLSSGQYETLMKAKEEDLNDDQKKEIAKTRTASIEKSLSDKAQTEAGEAARDKALKAGKSQEMAEREAAAARLNLTGDKALAAGIKKASLNQIKVLGEEALTKDTDGTGSLAESLTFSQIEDIKKGSGATDFTETEKERIVAAHTRGLERRFESAVASGKSKEVSDFLDGFKDEEIAKLPKSVLQSKAITEHLTIGRLSEMVKLAPGLRRDIAKELNNLHNPNGANPNHPIIMWLNTSPMGRRFSK